MEWIGKPVTDSQSTWLLLKRIVVSLFHSGRIFCGFVYLPVGICFSKAKKLPNALCLSFLVLGVVTQYIIPAVRGCILFVLLASIGLFELIISMELPNHRVFPAFRVMSTTVYFIQLYIWTMYYSLVYHKVTYGFDCFLVTSAFSLCLAWICSLMRRAR